MLAQAKQNLSGEHLTVDGTEIEAWASQKVFRRRTAATISQVSFGGDRATTRTHRRPIPRRLYRMGNGQEAKLGYLGHVLMENRHGFIVNAMPDGRAERDGATAHS